MSLSQFWDYLHSLLFNLEPDDPVVSQFSDYSSVALEIAAAIGVALLVLISKPLRTRKRPQDRLFLYTDGVPEANNAQEEMFGNERMLTGLNSLKEFTGEEFLQNMRDCVADYTKDTAQFDDITMMLFEVL